MVSGTTNPSTSNEEVNRFLEQDNLASAEALALNLLENFFGNYKKYFDRKDAKDAKKTIKIVRLWFLCDLCPSAVNKMLQ